MKAARIPLIAFLVCVFILTSCNLPTAQTQEGQVDSTVTLPANSGAGGTISGVVWHDLCAYSGGPAPNPLPPGCIANGSGGAAGNGTREAGEAGIPGVAVSLHSGDCVSAALSTSTTDGNGGYTFPNLPEGPYCVTIDANTPPNNAVLQPGVWTKPTSPTYFVQLADVLTPGGTLNLDFGWDFQNQPAANAPLPTAPAVGSPTPSGRFFIVDVPANCREGPDKVYEVITSYLAGTYLTLVGRNADNSWWLAQVDAVQNCWISGTTGHTSGDTASLPIVAAPPTPVLSPTPVSSGDTTPPSLTGDIAVNDPVYYNSSSCGSTVFNVAIHVNDDHLNSVWLTYRFKKSGYTGAWNTLVPNDNASGGLNGFNYDLSTQSAAELGSSDGQIQYQFFAKDDSNNQSSFPSGSVLSIPMQYCP